MNVTLAGFNVDLENIKKVKDFVENNNIESLKTLQWTPETISASYARISRDPRPIDQLREESKKEIDKARKSNKCIIFDMGHSSIAEHSVFNFDIVGVSRFLSEELEKSRLVSFTEKSQRYIKIGLDNYYPEEFKSDDNFFNKYTILIKEIFDTYTKIYDTLVPYFREIYKNINPKDKNFRDVINLAKEDARYILPLSTLTQLGMTINARNLERIIKKLSSANISEFNVLAKNLYDATYPYTPSLIKYTEPDLYYRETYSDIKMAIGTKEKNCITEDVELLYYDEDFENKLVASFILKTSDINYKNALTISKKLNKKKRMNILLTSVKHLSKHSELLREFEINDFEFGILISASAFAQLKRHRMATIIDSEYFPSLGNNIPKSIKDVGLENLFLEKIEQVNDLYKYARSKWERASQYILTNSHRKNLILKCNFRELCHIIRLRSDAHSQWDIREISNRLINLVEEKFPILTNILAGKDEFDVNKIMFKK